MSLAKKFFQPAVATLIVLIGPQRIECGVLSGSGKRAQWCADSISTIGIDAPEGDAPPVAAVAAALRQLPAIPAGAAMRVVVADNWLAAVTMPWSPAMQRPAAADLAARTRLAAAGFRIGPGDIVKVAEGPFGAPRLALVYPQALLEALSEMAGRRNARLDSVLALSVAGWTFAQRGGGAGQAALALLDDGLIVLARGAAGSRSRLNGLTVRTGHRAPEPDRRSLHALWQRLGLRDPQLAALGQVELLDLAAQPGASAAAEKLFVALDVPAPADGPPATVGLRLAAYVRARRDPLDALTGMAPLSAARMVLLALALLLAAGVVMQAARTDRSMRALQARLATVPRNLVTAPPAAVWNGEELARVQAVNTAIRELNLPFSAILHALAPPPDLRVAVLSVTTAAGSSNAQGSSIKIVAEARTGAEMARYVALLAERKPFTGAYLTEHEIDETSAERPYRFTLEAAWRD